MPKTGKATVYLNPWQLICTESLVRRELDHLESVGVSKSDAYRLGVQGLADALAAVDVVTS